MLNNLHLYKKFVLFTFRNVFAHKTVVSALRIVSAISEAANLTEKNIWDLALS